MRPFWNFFGRVEAITRTAYASKNWNFQSKIVKPISQKLYQQFFLGFRDKLCDLKKDYNTINKTSGPKVSLPDENERCRSKKGGFVVCSAVDTLQFQRPTCAGGSDRRLSLAAGSGGKFQSRAGGRSAALVTCSTDVYCHVFSKEHSRHIKRNVFLISFIRSFADRVHLLLIFSRILRISMNRLTMSR